MGASRVEVEQLSSINEVTVRGRVSAEPQQRTLPSGDALVSFRVVVTRSARARRRSKIAVDTFDCVAWTAATQRAASKLVAGDIVDVTGELRRRFRRIGGLPTSRVDIEIATCKKVG